MSHTFTYKLVTTRKNHGCANCGLRIPKGKQAHYWEAIFDGEWGRGYNCVACADDMKRNPDDYNEDSLGVDWQEMVSLPSWHRTFIKAYGHGPIIESLEAQLERIRKRDPRVLALPSVISEIEHIEADIQERRAMMENDQIKE